MSFVLSGYIIPPANEVRLAFEDKYIKSNKTEVVRHIQMEIEPGVILYIERYEENRNRGNKVSLERFEGKTLVSRTTGNTIEWTPKDSVWHIKKYLKRDFNGIYETIEKLKQYYGMFVIIQAFQSTDAKSYLFKLYEMETNLRKAIVSFQLYRHLINE